MDKPVKWRVQVEYVMACNCNYGCPCSFNAPPTYGACEAATAYHIVQGRYGDVALDGLNVALAAAWPGPLHERGGRAVLYLDERAQGRQREVLEAIATGRAGGPIGVWMSTITAGLEVRTAPVEIHAEGKRSWFRVPGQIEARFGPIRNPVTGAEHLPIITLATGMLTKKEECYSADTFIADAGELRFNYSGRNAYAFRHTWRGP